MTFRLAGPRSMKPLRSLSRRVGEVLGDDYHFRFEQHDFSPQSAKTYDPDLWVYNHADYWKYAKQANHSVNVVVSTVPRRPTRILVAIPRSR
ncbi:MAG: hypothetical protein IH986_11920 [Planctomycetes bacterium]|nr:hypothetical protein [Planctomycetota bacterium]